MLYSVDKMRQYLQDARLDRQVLYLELERYFALIENPATDARIRMQMAEKVTRLYRTVLFALRVLGYKAADVYISLYFNIEYLLERGLTSKESLKVYNLDDIKEINDYDWQLITRILTKLGMEEEECTAREDLTGFTQSEIMKLGAKPQSAKDFLFDRLGEL